MANQAIYAPFQVLDADGNPVAGALATFYASGTMTEIDVYEDAAETVVSANPVEADANGYLPQRFIAVDARCIITDADGVHIQTFDPVAAVLDGTSGASQVSFEPTAAIPFSTVQAAIVGVQSDLSTEIATKQDQNGYLDDIAAITPAAGDILYFNGTDWVRLAKGTARQVLAMNAGATAPSWASMGLAAVVTAEYTAGTDGAAFPTGSFAALTLNTERSDTIGISVASNRITFATAGTYLIQASVPARNSAGSGRAAQLRLSNYTTTTAIANGQVTETQAASAMALSLSAITTVAASDALELHGIASGSDVLQCKAGNFTTEVGAIVSIIRLS